MTIGNVFLKLILFAVLVALLLPTFLACNRAKQEEPPFELLEESSEKEMYSLYRIVLSATCSSELFCAAQELKERLSKQTNVPCDIVYDKEQVTQAKDIFEILLGNTNRAASQKAMTEFRENDYLCQMQDSTLLLGGRSDSATLAALERFYDELLEHATADAILPNEAGFLYRAEYPIQTITIGGFDLALFDIVYEKDASESMIFLAKTLQTALRTATAYCLDLQSEAEFSGTSKRIYLTRSDEETAGVAHIRFDAQGVVLSAIDLFGLSVAVRDFYHQLLTSVESSEPFGMPNTVKAANYERNELTLTSIFIDPQKDAASELTRINDLVQSAPSDFVFLGNMSETQRSRFYEMIDNQYHSTAGVEFLKAGAPCRLLKTLGTSANLYQVGNDTDGFLLLSAEEFPNEETLNTIGYKNLPLVIIVDCATSDGSWENDSFDRVIFATAEQASFSLWAEPHFFLVTEALSQNGYRVFTVERASAFYL